MALTRVVLRLWVAFIRTNLGIRVSSWVMVVRGLNYTAEGFG